MAYRKMTVEYILDDREIEALEAVDIVEMLGTMGEDKLHEVEKINANIIMRRLRKKVIQ